MNWSKSATGMEADVIMEGFKRSIEMHGLKYDKIIGKNLYSVYIRNIYFNYTIFNFIFR